MNTCVKLCQHPKKYYNCEKGDILVSQVHRYVYIGKMFWTVRPDGVLYSLEFTNLNKLFRFLITILQSTSQIVSQWKWLKHLHIGIKNAFTIILWVDWLWSEKKPIFMDFSRQDLLGRCKEDNTKIIMKIIMACFGPLKQFENHWTVKLSCCWNLQWMQQRNISMCFQKRAKESYSGPVGTFWERGMKIVWGWNSQLAKDMININFSSFEI